MSFAMHLVDTQRFDFEVIAILLYRSAGGEIGGLACDVLRVADRLWPHGANQPPDVMDWVYPVCEAVRGLRDGVFSERARITTVDELEASAAVVQFLLTTAEGDETLRIETCDVPSRLSIIRVRNPHLEALLRERPRDLDRITAYVIERGVEPDGSTTVEDLRKWLDSGTPAIADGWL